MGDGAEGDVQADAETVYLHFGDDVAPGVVDRVTMHIESVATRAVEVVPADEDLAQRLLHPDSLILSFGTTPSTRAVIPEEFLEPLAPEAFVMVSGEIGDASVFATDGMPLDPDPMEHPNLGIAFGAYAMLEELGFAFLHPLDPTLPEALPLDAPPTDHQTAPRWPVRGLQLHTMHPLELTDLLQGFGPEGPADADGWEGQLPDWDEYLEWSLANRQNRVHWVLLAADPWEDFADSEERIQRLGRLVDRAHEFGIWTGVDVPLALIQQHAWRLIRDQGSLEEEQAQIRQRIDYLMGADFDYLATESGTTEFTSVEDTRMVAWMDEMADYLEQTYGRQAMIKVHSSAGQTVDNYVDPDTDEPLNFNFLPHYASENMGVLPHTVQHYALDDPAPTYGNEDFDYIREFMQEEAGSRLTVWHPETAYWVSFDVDVPLFLPVYAHRRLHDLRLIAQDEDDGLTGRGEHAGEPVDGQITFSSGWEWAYWLPEVVTARGAWDPMMGMSEPDALRAALRPMIRVFGEAGPQLEDLLMDTMDAQLDLLILGKIDGVAPDEVDRRNGQGYLQGQETWDDISDLANDIPGVHTPMTQPDKLGLVEMRNPFHDPPGYSAEVEPLLAEMEERFVAIADAFDALEPKVPANAMPLYVDMRDAARMTAFRAIQVHGLYDYVDGFFFGDPDFRKMRLDTAKQALDDALVLAVAHEGNYRVDPERIAGWRDNPTAYEFTYLWTVRSLYYWWRDEGKAVDVPISPCYLNIINPVSVGLGEGTLSDASDVLSALFDNVPGIGAISECLGAPMSEPQYPPAGLRD